MQKLFPSLSASLIVLGIAVVLAVVTLAGIAQANPSFFIRQNNGTGTTATTSVTYMSVGTATTTAYFDALSSGSPYGADSATLLWQMTATSTNSTTDLYIEYADITSGVNCTTSPTACDWYSNALASTSPANINTSNISAVPFVRWRYGANTQGLVAGVPADSRSLRIVDVPVPTRYARAIFVIPDLTAQGTASSSAVWAQFVAKKEDK